MQGITIAYLIGVGLGTSETKTVLFRKPGEVLASATFARRETMEKNKKRKIGRMRRKGALRMCLEKTA